MCRLRAFDKSPSTHYNTVLKHSTDFSIEVINEENGEVDVYLVHKVALVSGTYKSDFFQGLLFNTADEEEVHRASCKIKLRASAAQLFPEALEFIYTGKWKYTSNRKLVSLFALADYLGISDLKEKIRHVIQSLDAAVAFYLLSEAYHLQSNVAFDVLLEVLKTSGVRLFKHVEAAHFLSLTPSAFNIILNLMFEKDRGFLASSEDFSIALAIFLEAHPELYGNWKLLAQLTNPLTMPVVSTSSAFFFLKLTSSTTADGDEDAVKSLEQRCLISCENWQRCRDVVELYQAMANTNDSCCDAEDPCIYDFSNLPDSVKVKVLQMALKGCCSNKLNDQVFLTSRMRALLSAPLSHVIGNKRKVS
jgi:hypothetical protein